MTLYARPLRWTTMLLLAAVALPAAADDAKPPAANADKNPAVAKADPKADAAKPNARPVVNAAAKDNAAPKANDVNGLKEPPGNVKPLARRPKGRLPIVSSVTRDIANEARKGWAEERQWPHDYADYSSRADTGLTNRQLITALIKRQHDHPALDGYVRWQLLSFAPDLKEAQPFELKRLISSMPKLIALPTPPTPRNVLQGGGGGMFFSGTQKAFLSDLRPVPGTGLARPRLGVINNGAGLSSAVQDPEEVIEKSRGAAYDLLKTREPIITLNTPTVRFRTALMSLLPVEGGIRLEAMFEDLKDRIEAGDPSYKQAAQAFYDEAQRTRADASIPQRTRANLAHRMRQLSIKRTLVADEIKIDDAGNMKVKATVVMFPRKFVAPLLANLRGAPKDE